MKLDRSYRRLPACRAAMRLAQAIYDVTAYFPDIERSGMIATLRRTAASIPTILADSQYQQDPEEADRKIATAQDTLRELAAYLDVAERLRLTRRWRFSRSRRRARATAAHLQQMRRKSVQPPATYQLKAA